MRPGDFLFLPLTVINGCATVVDPPPHPGRTPVVEALLIGGTDTATFRLTWADSVASSRPDPIRPADVQLTLRTADGPGVGLVPHPDSAGWFLATLAIAPGKQYRLDGTILGRAVAAATTIPASFTVAAPAGDVAAGVLGAVEPFRWRAVGATVFAADYAVFGASQYHHTRDTTGLLLITAVDPARSPTLTLWALNADAERYLHHPAAPTGNVAGGLGMLGGALTARRAFRWP